VLELIGLIGGFCFAYCGVPTMLRTIKAGKSIGTPADVAWFIFLGGLFMYTYLYFKFGFDWILTINYIIEVGSWGTILGYHYKPVKEL